MIMFNLFFFLAIKYQKRSFSYLDQLHTFASSDEFPRGDFEDKRGLMYSTLVSNKVVLRSDTTFGAQLLQEADGGFALEERHDCKKSNRCLFLSGKIMRKHIPHKNTVYSAVQ